MDALSAEFTALMDAARQLLQEHPDAQQVIVLKTATGSHDSVINLNIMEGDHRAEDECIQTLEREKNTEVSSVVCMWDTGGVDVPSWHFRQKLLALNSKNENTQTVLQGPGVFHVKPFKALMPPKKESRFGYIERKERK